MTLQTLVPLVGLAIIGCNAKRGVESVAVAQTAEQKANSNATAAALGGQGTVLQVAIPVEVSAGGIKTLGEGRLIRAPRPQPGAGPQLLVTLEGPGGKGGVVRQYELPDPRLTEVEGEGQKVVGRARTYVYVELSDAASEIDVKPTADGESVLGRSMEFSPRAKTSIPLTAVVEKACTGPHASSALCRANKQQ